MYENTAAALQPAPPAMDLRPATEEILQVRNLTKVYPGSAVPALNGLDFTVREGEIFGLLGPNGAGKTTAISIICTLLRPTGGKVVLCGRDVCAEPGAVRHLFGLAPQDLALYPNLTLRENLRYFGRLYHLRGNYLDERIDESVALVGLNDSADRLLAIFSGGMKRRANLAAALLHTPRVLVLDEPTVGIDPQSRHMILENLSALRQAGMTIVYTTHYMEEAQQLCDRIGVMDAGVILAEGSPRELLGSVPECNNLEELFLHLTGKQLRD